MVSTPAVAPTINTYHNTGSLLLNLFDGTRQPIVPGTQLLVRLIDGNQNEIKSDFYTQSSLLFQGLPFYNNFGDNYTVVVSADGYGQAGFTPVRIAPNTVQHVDLMLLPADGTFNFHDALWPSLKQSQPEFAALLAHGAADDQAAQDRYTQLMENHPAALASFFNLTTAMSAINLPGGTPLDYIKEVIWDNTFAQDRFFGWVDPGLIDQIKIATQQDEFAPEVDPWIFHPSATSSWKQIQFGEANVQLTFHEGQTKVIDGLRCVMIEPDIDYYKDLGGHFLLEVVVNAVSHTLTDPKQVYVLRWIAGRHAGVAEFNPPYTLTA
jgi:hypothetical protein